ncbi:hypothetical protein [Haloarchaeobius sp. DYHT-AS-18]|uniref:hypothetical protein n=1 Tax=Haloarchaeobius sp. DYHT-AS-18 TaxID=3446117 RepID=UPI003EC0A110
MNWEAVRRRLPTPSDASDDRTESAGDAAADDDTDPSPALSRRRLLAGVGGLGALGAGKAVDNIFLGYGILMGTNLLTQDTARLAGERLGPTPFETTVADHILAVDRGQVHVGGADASADPEPVISLAGSPTDAAEVDDEYGLPGVTTELVRDDPPLAAALGDVNATEVDGLRFEFHQYEAFFERVQEADSRPFSVMRLRGDRYRPIGTETIRAFTDADPSDPKAVIEGLVGGFREYSGYDLPRYAAGSLEDNVLMGHGDLRDHFESPTTYDALLSGRNTGLFCYEFVHRSIEALHAVPAHEQTAPVFAGVVTDERHKHAYTAVGSVIREDGELVVPVTFVDYTHSTLYDDLLATGVLGRGLRAYDDRHRASDIYWNAYARV